MRRHPLFWGIIGLALAVGIVTTLDRYQRQGRIFAGFWVMENLLVAVGGPERGPFQPFDIVRVMNGQVLQSGRDIQTMIDSEDPRATFRYVVYRRGQLVEAEVPTRLFTRRDFVRFLVEGLVPGLLQLAIGAVVFLIRPGRSQSWLFLAFLLIAYVVSVTYADAHTTYRFTELFLTAWAFWPATLLHLALTFPQRRGIVRRFPRVVWLPYLISGAMALLLNFPGLHGNVRLLLAVPAAAAAYWGVALILLVLSLARASMVGGTPLIRQRARILCAAFVLAYVPADPRHGGGGALPGDGPLPERDVEADAPVPRRHGLRPGPLRPLRRARGAPGRRRLLRGHRPGGAGLHGGHCGDGHPPDQLGSCPIAHRRRRRHGGARRGAAEPALSPLPAGGRPLVLPAARRRAAVHRARVRGHERAPRPAANRPAAHADGGGAAPPGAAGALPPRRGSPAIRARRPGGGGRGRGPALDRGRCRRWCGAWKSSGSR